MITLARRGPRHHDARRSSGKMKILILEDNEERIAAFRVACAALSAEAIVWRNAHRMVEDIGQQLAAADVISLDHDLNDDVGEDAGCGMDVARELARHKPTCPILMHTSNTTASWSMLSELRLGGWEVSRVPPVTMGTAWIKDDWVPAVRRIIETTKVNKRVEFTH
ncbi:MAG: response regulator [Kiritimatiellae bacterium]|nr:response regulator [Kiritimatiellia bacterium]MDD5523452.1 response regulator [Kiritimatiellia bacterium]